MTQPLEPVEHDRVHDSYDKENLNADESVADYDAEETNPKEKANG